MSLEQSPNIHLWGPGGADAQKETCGQNPKMKNLAKCCVCKDILLMASIYVKHILMFQGKSENGHARHPVSGTDLHITVLSALDAS